LRSCPSLEWSRQIWKLPLDRNSLTILDNVLEGQAKSIFGVYYFIIKHEERLGQ